MLTLCKSTVLGAAFLAGVAIAANADPLCCTPTGPCRPPGPQIAALPPANGVGQCGAGAVAVALRSLHGPPHPIHPKV